MTSEDKCREAFEAKFSHVDLAGRYDEWEERWKYVFSHVDAMWKGFQAGAAWNAAKQGEEK